LDLDRAHGWIGFGGIRIEDDIHVTETTPEVLTAAIPKSVPDVEAAVAAVVTPFW
jgi:Xaa-Pro aminopeptidase